MNRLRLLLADDHAVVREGLKALLDAQPDLEVVGEAADGHAAVELAARLDPDVAVVDVSMPGLNGADATARMIQAKPGRKVVALTVHEDKGYLRRMLSAGAAGYVLKRAAAAELVGAVRAVAAGGTYIDPAFGPDAAEGLATGGPLRPLTEVPEDVLSDREGAVLRLIAQGYSNKEIASRLTLSVKTIETYKTRSLEKLGLRSRVDIVRYASARGWLGEG